MSMESNGTLEGNALPLRFFWPCLRKKCKKQTGGVMRTDTTTDESVWGQHTVNVKVCKHRVLENVPDTSCTTTEETVLGGWGHQQHPRCPR